LRPTVVQVLIDPFLAAQLSNAVLAAQALQHDADLLFSGMMPARGSANIPDCLFSALRYALSATEMGSLAPILRTHPASAQSRRSRTLGAQITFRASSARRRSRPLRPVTHSGA